MRRRTRLYARHAMQWCTMAVISQRIGPTDRTTESGTAAAASVVYNAATNVLNSHGNMTDSDHCTGRPDLRIHAVQPGPVYGI